MSETYQQRKSRNDRNNTLEQRYYIPTDLYFDAKTAVDRLKKKDSTWSMNRFVLEGVRAMVKKYSR